MDISTKTIWLHHRGIFPSIFQEIWNPTPWVLGWVFLCCLFSVQGLNSTKSYNINIELNSGSSYVLPFFWNGLQIASVLLFSGATCFWRKKKRTITWMKVSTVSHPVAAVASPLRVGLNVWTLQMFLVHSSGVSVVSQNVDILHASTPMPALSQW